MQIENTKSIFYFSNQEKYFLCGYILLKIGLILAFHSSKLSFFSMDSQYYENLALGFLNNSEYYPIGCKDLYADIVRTPGFPALIILVYSLFGNQFIIIAFLNLLFFLLEILLIKYLCKQIQIKWSQLVLIFSLFDFTRFMLNKDVLSEPLFNVFLLLSIIMLISGWQQNQLKSYLLSGFFLGISTLIKPITLYLPLLIIPFLIISQWDKKIILSSILLVASFALTISPWMIRNFLKYNTLSFTNIQNDNLLMSHCIYILAEKENRNFREVQLEMYNKVIKVSAEKKISSYASIDSLKLVMAKEIISNNRWLYAKTILNGMAITLFDPARMDISRGLNLNYTRDLGFTDTLPKYGLWGTFKLIVLNINVLNAILIYNLIFLAIFFVLYILGFGLIVFKSLSKEWILIMIIFTYLWVLGGPSGNARFRYYLFPFLMLFAMYSQEYILRLIQSIKKRQ